MSLNKFGGSFFVKNPNEKCNNFKVYFWKVPGVSLPIRQLDNLFEHLFLQFQVILIIVLFVTPTSDQTFGHSILINYDYNKSLFVLSVHCFGINNHHWTGRITGVCLHWWVYLYNVRPNLVDWEKYTGKNAEKILSISPIFYSNLLNFSKFEKKIPF